MPVIDSNDGGDPAANGSGPCTPYIQTSDWAESELLCGAVVDAETETYSAAASDLLYVLLGRQFPGVCTATVRPVRSGGCRWDQFAQPRFADTCDSSGNRIALYNPVVSVDEVKIDGTVVTGWYLRNNHILCRSDGTSWPSNQSLELPDSETDTFSITYTFGPVTPYYVKLAAIEYAINLYLADHPSAGVTSLPAGYDSVSRQGMSVSARQQQTELRQQGPALPNIMAAIAAYNPKGERAPADIWDLEEWDLVRVS